MLPNWLEILIGIFLALLVMIGSLTYYRSASEGLAEQSRHEQLATESAQPAPAEAPEKKP